MMNKKVFALAGLLAITSTVANTAVPKKESGGLKRYVQFAKENALAVAALWQIHGFITGLGNIHPILTYKKLRLSSGARDLQAATLSTDFYKGLNPATLNLGYTLGSKCRANTESWKPLKWITHFAQYLCGHSGTELPILERD